MGDFKKLSNSNHNNGVSSSTSRGLIPNNLKKTIQNIKEIAKNHSEDDIYAMLKECSMDPNETVQRLLHLDTFHQVKSKRGKRNEVVKSRPGEDSRWKPGHHGRGFRGGRGNNSCQYSSSDAGGRRSDFTRKENGVDENGEKDSRNPSAPVLKETDPIQPCPAVKALPISTNGPVKMPNGNLGGGRDSKPYQIDTYRSKESTGAGADSLSSVRPKASAEQVPSPTVPVLIPAGHSWITAVKASQREVNIKQITIEASAHTPVDSGWGKTESTSNSHQNQSDLQNVVGSLESSSVVEKEASIPADDAVTNVSRDLPAAEKIHVPNSISAIKPALQDVGPPAGVEEAAPKLVKNQFFDGQNVIIPDHIQVSDAVKNMLSFGSTNASVGVRGNSVKNENVTKLQSTRAAAADEATEKSSSCDNEYKDAASPGTVCSDKENEGAVSPATQAEHADNQQLQSHFLDENHPIDTQLSSSKNDDQRKEDNSPVVGPPFPIIETSPRYSFGFMPSMVANTIVQSEGFESEARVPSSRSRGSPAVSTPPLTQSSGVGHTSIAVSPQQVPLIRQYYPPNYIPYGHYSPFYVPPTMHHYYGHTGFLQPLPTSNVFLPPPTSATTMKTPAHYKQGANAGNQTPNGVPSGYGVYSTSQAGYNPNTAVASGNPSTGADLMRIAPKDNYMYPGLQSEGSPFWLSAPGRDNSNFPLNSFINFPPQAHHLINPHSGHGSFAVYHSMQPMPMPTPGPGLPLPQHSQLVTVQVEPAANPYQQSLRQHQHPHQQQSQMNWNL